MTHCSLVSESVQQASNLQHGLSEDSLIHALPTNVKLNSHAPNHFGSTGDITEHDQTLRAEGPALPQSQIPAWSIPSSSIMETKLEPCNTFSKRASVECTSFQDTCTQPSIGKGNDMSVERPSTWSTNGADTTDAIPASMSGNNGNLRHAEIIPVSDDTNSLTEHPVKTNVHIEKGLEPSPILKLKPRRSILHFSSLDNLMDYREEKAQWTSALMLRRAPSMDIDGSPEICDHANNMSNASTVISLADKVDENNERSRPRLSMFDKTVNRSSQNSRRRFRNLVAEIGFCFTIAMTQFLCEYLVSGFALELPRLANRYAGSAAGSTGLFWPASLLTLVLSASLLFWARLSDMYGGYLPFMFGALWLAIWTLIPGFVQTYFIMDISRAMQGFAIAAFIPSTFAMVGSIYPEGSRRNLVLGLYSGCAPLGFFAGFILASAFKTPQWYFWIASVLSLMTLITGFLTVPSDRTDRSTLALKMDWIGTLLIACGLTAVSYALAVEPHASLMQSSTNGWRSPVVAISLTAGLLCLAMAFWYEGWRASCPLLPFDFFQLQNVKSLSIACLCFYASYGAWLYESAEFFQSPAVTGLKANGVQLALWYTPTALGGLVLCIVGGLIMHVVPIMALLLLSALAWITAPLLLAVAPLPLSYWSYVVPSMLCATIGIDLTFTVSIVYLSAIQPLRYQGLSGAVCSILVNLAMSFALSVSEIVGEAAVNTHAALRHDRHGNSHLSASGDSSTVRGFRAAFAYGAASAGLGLVICVLFVRISRASVMGRSLGREASTAVSSELTLVDENMGRWELETGDGMVE